MIMRQRHYPRDDNDDLVGGHRQPGETIRQEAAPTITNNIGRLGKKQTTTSLLVLLSLALLFLVSPLPARLAVHSSCSYAKHTAELAAVRQQYTTTTTTPGVNVSVVIMNHNRPRMIRESMLMKTLLAHPSVNEILMCHSNAATAFEWHDAKIININAIADNERTGLALRFQHCATATNKFVLIVDDDMEFAPLAVTDLIGAMMQNPNRIVGKYGRGYHYWTAIKRNGYHTRTLYGPVEVVLTKFMMLPKELCAAFFDYEYLVKNDFVPRSRPLWNGEDIFINLVANHVYNVPPDGPFNNWAIADLEVWEASDAFKDDDTGAHDVSGNMDRHTIWSVGLGNWLRALQKANKHAAYRGELWAAAKHRLAALKRSGPIVPAIKVFTPIT
jgi:hypothetical protein